MFCPALRLVPLLLIAGLPVCACSSADPDGGSDGESPPTPVEIHGQLRAEGNRIVDQSGEVVVLRGMSLFWSQWMGQFYNASAIRWLRDDWNVNIVRAAMGVHSGGYLQNPTAERQKVERVIDAAIDLGIYVVVDWHAHDPEPEAAAAFFAQIAAKYGDYPNVIYETWNEPLDTHDWSSVIKPYHESVAAQIRAVDPDNLILLGTQTWSQDVDKAAADPVIGANLAYTLHFYAGTHGAFLRDKAKAALASGAALVVTEWGTSESDGDGHLAISETGVWLEFMDAHDLSWCNWSVADKEEISAALMPGAAASGGWPDEMISESGHIVRQALRRRNP
jgi:endoglucanase